MDKDEKIKELEDENIKLKEQLDKYLLKNKTYYENNKTEHKQRVKEYQQRTNYKSDYKPTTEQKKIYNKHAYIRRQEKLKKEIEENLEKENV
jgi:hypothetical protein